MESTLSLARPPPSLVLYTLRRLASSRRKKSKSPEGIIATGGVGARSCVVPHPGYCCDSERHPQCLRHPFFGALPGKAPLDSQWPSCEKDRRATAGLAASCFESIFGLHRAQPWFCCELGTAVLRRLEVVPVESGSVSFVRCPTFGIEPFPLFPPGDWLVADL